MSTLAKIKAKLTHLESPTFQDTANAIEILNDEIYISLSKNAIDVTRLDDTGLLTAEQMENYIETLTIAAHLRSAHGRAEEIKYGNTARTAASIEDDYKNIKEHLKFTKQEWSILNEPGKNLTSNQVEDEFKLFLKNRHIRSARAYFINLLIGKDICPQPEPKDTTTRDALASCTLRFMQENLDSANKSPLTVLQETGGYTAKQVEDQIDQAISKWVHLYATPLKNQMNSAASNVLSVDDWMVAAQSGDMKKISDMLAKGMNVNATDANGLTALDYAEGAEYDARTQGRSNDAKIHKNTIAALKNAGADNAINIVLTASSSQKAHTP